MIFNYQKEKAKFLVDWQQEETLLRSQKVSEEIIAEMYRFSLEQFRSNRNYYLHKEEFASADALSEEIDLEANLDFLDSIENMTLLTGLMSLSKDELSIIKLHCVEKLSLSKIADMKKEKYDTIQKRFYRAKSKLKKYL